MIGGLPAGLAIVAAGTGATLPASGAMQGRPRVSPVLGRTVILHGVETARPPGRTDDPQTRIRAIRPARIVPTAICMVRVLLPGRLLGPEARPPGETAISGVMAQDAPILPPLLILAASDAEFGAAVAGTGGAGGRSRNRPGGANPT